MAMLEELPEGTDVSALEESKAEGTSCSLR